MKANQQRLVRQIVLQFQGKRHNFFTATDHEISHCRDIFWSLQAKEAPDHIKEGWSGISWIVELNATCTSDGKPFQACTCFSPAFAQPQKLCCNW